MEEKFSQLFPLLLFTALFVFAVGLQLGLALEIYSADGQWQQRSITVLASFLIASAGIAFSLFHLGRKTAAYRAIAGFRHSWLSRETVFAGLFLFFSGLLLMLDFAAVDETILQVINLCAALTGLAALLAIGMLYRLPAQMTWSGWANYLAPITGASLLAISIAAFWVGRSLYIWAFAPVLFFDLLLSFLRFRCLVRVESNQHALLFPGLDGIVHALYRIRFFVLLIIIPVLIYWLPPFVPALLMLNIVIDRFCFYASAAQLTPRAGIAAIKEQRMRAAAAHTISSNS